MALRDDILSDENDNFGIEKVETPEWKKTPHVFVREFSALEMKEFFRLSGEYAKAGKDYIPNAHICVLAICDEQGKQVFSDGDIAAFSKKSSKVIARIVRAWSKLNGLDEAMVKEQEKNS